MMRIFFRLMRSCKAMTNILFRTLEKDLLNVKISTLRNIFRHLLHVNFFIFVLLISNHMVFLVQFEINLHL